MVCADALAIEQRCDLSLGQPLQREEPVHATHRLYLFGRAGSEDHAVRLKALLFALRKLGLWTAMLVDQEPPQSEPGGTALAKTVVYETALAGEDLGR
jgi:hypothetical protein